MRAVIQRVARARVSVAGRVTGSIDRGLLVLAGVAPDDLAADRAWIAAKIVGLRIFDDDAGAMNRSVREVEGSILAVSQFTLFASTRKGNRPSWSAAAPPEIAAPAFEDFVARLSTELGRGVATGVFGAHMAVELVNDGPVTISIDSRMRE